MVRRLLRTVVLKLISYGFTIPEVFISGVAEAQSVNKILSTWKINTVIDVGAHEGQTVQRFRQIGFEGYIFSFEPNGQVFARLSSKHESDARWRGYQVALGAKDGYGDLFVNIEADVMSSLLKPIHQPRKVRVERVKIARLDSFLTEIEECIKSPRILLKTDAEGMDSQVIAGAEETLKYVHCVQMELFLEPIYEHAKDYKVQLAQLEAMGFQIAGITVVSRGQSGAAEAMNCILVRN